MKDSLVGMVIYGFDVDCSVVNRVIGAIQDKNTFTSKDVEQCFLSLGVPHFTKQGSDTKYIANRAADRLIQRLRKADRISFNTNRAWVWLS